jgi:tetratricopeptide (TPR) repeat protein
MNRIKKHARPELIVCFILVVIILAAYWQLPTHDFLVFDDNKYITHNSHVHDGINWKNLAWAFSSTDFGYWHPLTWLSHMLAFQLFGLKFGMHHLINLFLHIANTLLLFMVLKRMTGALWQSAFVAAMFALHPLNVESVAWASERKNVLSTFFWMLTMLTYVRYAERPGFHRYLLTLFVFVLGLMAKPVLVTLPFVLLLLDYWPLCRFNLARLRSDNKETHTTKITGFQRSPVLRLVLEKIPFLLLSAVCIYLSSLSIQRFGIVISTASVTMKLRIANALVSYVSYIKKMVWPHNLAVFYPYPQTLPLWQTVGAGLLLLCISFLVLRAVRSKPYLAVGWVWYMGTLVPAIGLVQAGLWPAIADRFTYVPLIGLFIVIAWGIPDLVVGWRFRNKGLAVIAATLFPILMATTWLQIRHWQNGVTLFTHNLNVTHNNNLAHNELGNALKQQGKFEKAMFHYSKALQINPNYAEAHNNLGYTLIRQKDYQDAIYHYSEALRIKPTYAEAHNNLGTALLYQGNDKEAIYHYYEALRINPNYAGVYYNLGKLFVNHGKIEKAILLYRKALDLNPEMTHVLYNLSWILASHEDEKYRNGEEALKLAEKLCKITQYHQPLALDALAAASAEKGRFSEAVLTAKKALKLALLYGPKELVLGLQKRLKLYQTKRPYRQGLQGKNES